MIKKKNDLLISSSLLENPEELMVPTNHYSLSDPLNNLASPFFDSRIREYLCRIYKVFPVIALETVVSKYGRQKDRTNLVIGNKLQAKHIYFQVLREICTI